MKFKEFKELVDLINNKLGSFCNEFGLKRKELAKLGKSPKRGVLFAFNDKNIDRDWAINEGGGIEIQYHIGLDTNQLFFRYGLGFNSQYVQFANQMSPVEYMRPFMNAFILNEKKIRTLLPEYDFVIGNKKNLIYPQHDDYVLFGKMIKISKVNSEFIIDDLIFEQIINDLKSQFLPYQIIFKNKQNSNKISMQNIKYTELLKYKKQIILQGPPGTGKTRLAKELADELTSFDISDKDIALLKESEELKTLTAQSTFIIIEVNNAKRFVRVKPTNSANEYSITFDQIIECIDKSGWNDKVDSWNSHGNASYLVSIAKNIKIRKIDEADKQIKLIQFHPSYTYEDFVRGIVAKPNPEGQGIIYESENKTLGHFAKLALDNYLASQGIKNNNSEFEDKLKILLEEINNTIDSGKTFKFSDKSTAEIISIGNDYLIYNFPNREDIRYKLLFSDIEKVYDNRNDIKIPTNLRDKEKSLQLEMKGKFPYYFMILEKLKSISTTLKTDDEVQELKNYVLIIDEINRANLSSVLGELIYALEYRNEKVESVYEIKGEGNQLILPPNLYIIGTMNTADRSVGHIDYAIRRRFAFVDVLPKDLSNDNDVEFDSNLFSVVKALFTTDDYKTHSNNLSKEFEPKDVALGHSYFIQQFEKSADGKDDKSKPIDFRLRLEYEIKPILLEYVKDGILVGNDIIQKIESLDISI